MDVSTWLENYVGPYASPFIVDGKIKEKNPQLRHHPCHKVFSYYAVRSDTTLGLATNGYFILMCSSQLSNSAAIQ